MHDRQSGDVGTPPQARPRPRALALVVFLLLMLVARSAGAVPSFARQTGEPCSDCHVGAFGPQLTQAGRDFKLNGYVFTDGKEGHIPLAGMGLTSFTHTNSDQPGGAAAGFAANNNIALDQASIFVAGRWFDHVGSFIQTTYDGVSNGFAWDNLDVRYANTATLFEAPWLFGATVNNNPTVQDAWNSTPAWGFPFATSSLAPEPAAATVIDSGLAQQVLGAGAYTLWNHLLYLEADVYHGLGRDVRNALGVVPVSGSNSVKGLIPYWRVALQHDFGPHYLELGTFGLIAQQFPGGDKSTDRTDRFTDTAVDLTYLYSGDPNHIFTGYVTWIHENQKRDASSLLTGTNPSDTLDTLRINGSYSFRNTLTLSAQRFQTYGSSDAALYSGSPDSSGWIGEIAYVPSGKKDSFFPTWFNARLSLQYTYFNKFDGETSHASNNNALFALLWLAF